MKEIGSPILHFIKEGFILHHPTSYGEQVSLNPRKVSEAKKPAGATI